MGTQEVLGYLAMFIALTFVFFGIKSYRDKEARGKISFGKGLKIGMLITLIPAFLFGVFDVIYITLLNPGFFEEYRTAMITKMESQYSGAELAAKIAEFDSMMAMAGNPWFDFMLMFITVVLLGFIVSLISSFVLRSSTVKA
jgi:hypothetical protein